MENKIFNYTKTVKNLSSHNLDANTRTKHQQEIVGWQGKETLSNFT